MYKTNSDNARLRKIDGDNLQQIEIVLPYNEGERLIAQNKHKEALEHYEDLLFRRRHIGGEEHPRLAVIYFSIAKCWYELKDLKEAYSFFERALTIDRKNYTAPSRVRIVQSLDYMGKIHLSKGEQDAAHLRFCEALDMLRHLYNRHPEAYSALFGTLSKNIEKTSKRCLVQ